MSIATPAITALVSSSIFTGRGINKTENGLENGNIGDTARAVTTLGQGLNAVNSLAGVGCKSAMAVVKTIDDVAKQESIWGGVANATKWVSKSINPLIGVCAAVKVCQSDNKVEEFAKQSFGFGGMVGSEALMNQIRRETTVVKDVIEKIKSPKLKIAAMVAEGLIYAAGSVSGYTMGEKLGDKLANWGNAS